MSTSERTSEDTKSHVSAIRGQIFGYIDLFGIAGVTLQEIEEELGIEHQSVIERVRELVESGHIIANGKTRTAHSGHTSGIYVVNREDRRQLKLW